NVLDSYFDPFILYILIYLFSFNDTAPTQTYTLSLHDALPISLEWIHRNEIAALASDTWGCEVRPNESEPGINQPWHWIVIPIMGDRKSTRLNSSHLGISYAVFCLKKKKKKKNKK